MEQTYSRIYYVIGALMSIWYFTIQTHNIGNLNRL